MGAVDYKILTYSLTRRALKCVHALVGGVSYGLAIAAIFQSVPLKDSVLPKETYVILIGYLVFHVITHIYLSIDMCRKRHQVLKVWQSATLLLIRCKSAQQPVPARVEEPVTPIRQSASGGATNNPPFPKMP